MNFAKAVRDYKPGKKIDPTKYDFPDVEDGVRGLAFVDTVIRSSRSNQKWTKVKV